LANLGKYKLGKQQHYLLKNVIDINKFDASTNIYQKKLTSNGKLVVTTVSNLHKVKRLDRFLTVIAAVKKYDRAIKGIIVGDGPERNYLIQKAKTFGLNEENISFLGTRSDVPYILSQSHIFMLTSDHEGSPNAMLEAMTAGLPIIATPAGDCPRIVHHDINGFIVDYKETEKMAEKVILLSQNQKLRHQMGTKSRQIIEEHYNYDQLQKNLMAIYSQIPHHHKKNKKKTSSNLIVND
jgi:glycosyltransferase involved in cell wall biosynthesis